MKQLLSCCTLLLLLLLPLSHLHSSEPNTAPNDFDGDGLTDLIESVSTAHTTTIAVRRSSDQQLVIHNFPGSSMKQITGKFYSDGLSYPGTISETSPNEPLLWQFLTLEGTINSVRFGLPGDTIPNLGDIDCDGRTDLIVTRPGNSAYYPGFRLWYAALTGGGVIETVFGLSDDLVATGNVDGDLCDEMIALRPTTFEWFSRKLTNSIIRSVQWGLPGDIPLLPGDLNHDGVPDYIISRRENGSQTAYVKFGDSQSATIPMGTPSSVPFTGNFFGDLTLGWTDRILSLTNVKLSDGQDFGFSWGTQNNTIRPDGTVVTVTNDGSFGNFGDHKFTSNFNIGRAPLAIMHKGFPCDTFIQSMATLPVLHIAFLWNTFGHPDDGSGDASCLIRLMNDPRLKSLQIITINEVCQRNRNCEEYEFLYNRHNFNKLLEVLDPATVNATYEYWTSIGHFLDKHLRPHTQCYISPGLESNLSRPSSDHLVSMARAAFPQCKIVYNPNGGNRINQDISGADFIERHTNRPNFGGVPCIGNNDGRDISFPSSRSNYLATMSETEMRKYLTSVRQQCEIAFVWIKEDNCRYINSWSPPRQRSCEEHGRMALTGQLISSMLP